MQALRKAPLELAPFLRQTAADFLNSGLEHEVDLDLRLPKAPLPRIEADAFYCAVQLNNLLLNAARHAPPGSVICLGVTNSVGAADPCGPPSPTCVLWVENQTGQARPSPLTKTAVRPMGRGGSWFPKSHRRMGDGRFFRTGRGFGGRSGCRWGIKNRLSGMGEPEGRRGLRPLRNRTDVFISLQ